MLVGEVVGVVKEGWREERKTQRWRLLKVKTVVEAEKGEQLKDQTEQAGAAADLTEGNPSLGCGAAGGKVRWSGQ